MLNQLLSNLKFRPSQIRQLDHYRSRETKDRKLRFIGLIFVVLALLVQCVAFYSSPKSQADASNNDIIHGGVTSASQIYTDCADGYSGAVAVYANYGVYCSDIKKAVDNGDVVELKSTDYNDKLWGVGYLPYNIAGETPVHMTGKVNGEYVSWTIYWRLLHGWDTIPYSTYKALKVTSQDGKTYYILFTCGNLISIGFPVPYTPPTPTPTPTVTTIPTTTTPVPATTTPAVTPTPTTTTPTTPACPYNSQILQTDSQCKPCASSTSIYDSIDCVTYSKSATNITQNISDANNTTANAGDVIQFTLTATNPTDATVSNFMVQDDVSDDLDYANPVNLNGGSIDSSGILSWPAANIAPNSSVSETYTMQIKNPVPLTSPGADDPDGYNFIITDVYGNTININIAKPVVVAVASSVATSTSLPNTGPGTDIFIFAALSIVVGFFYFRSRLLVNEAGLAIDYALRNEVEDE